MSKVKTNSNTHLRKANKAKNDEFYTQLVDIEKELKHYKEQFKGKVVYCNCDDPFESNFFKYFASNFNALKLKRLIATSYKPSPIANTQLGLFGDDKTLEPVKGRPKTNANKLIINEVNDLDGDGAFDLRDIAEQLKANKNNEWSPMEGDGDFRSPESIELLKQADIVVTNPPFSLFRDYVTQLVEHNKKFLIIGTTNALTYKDIFKLIKENKIRTGYTNFNVGMFFEVPKEWEKYHHIDENGKKIARVSTSCWFTNLDVEKHKQDIVLYKKYNEIDYPNYENYKAIDISKVQEIPMDYKKEMGVPITFVDKYNPDQFEIIALGIVGSIDFTKNRKMEILKDGKSTGKFTVNAKGTLYRKYNSERDEYPAFRDVETNELYSSIYARIIIKNKKPQK
ncbi:adenine-specific methyltransferase EcoRI family protein [Candidatus Nomurabacteria bacterium]|nr:adenine-specific methyltransferase EcoRI family protein [Candidatus Nomurabacteria bacterium]